MKKTISRILAALMVLLGVLLYVTPGVQFLGICLFGLAVMTLLYPYFRKAVTIVLCVLLAALLIMEIPIIHASRQKAPGDLDYIIVLGAAVYGETPSPALMERITAAADYLKQNPDTKAVLSGGWGEGDSVSEAQAMRNTLVAMGIDAERLLLEEEATNTNENIRFSFAILLDDWEAAGHGDSTPTVAIVSSEYHLFRAVYLAKKAGYTVSGVPATTRVVISRINYFVREAPAMLKAVFLDW